MLILLWLVLNVSSVIELLKEGMLWETEPLGNLAPKNWEGTLQKKSDTEDSKDNFLTSWFEPRQVLILYRFFPFISCFTSTHDPTLVIILMFWGRGC